MLFSILEEKNNNNYELIAYTLIAYYGQSQHDKTAHYGSNNRFNNPSHPDVRFFVVDSFAVDNREMKIQFFILNANMEKIEN